MAGWALKEWAAVVRALEAGAIAALARKGGLRDGREGLGTPPPRFWLWPTAYHQEALLLRPALHTFLGPPPDGALMLRSWAELVAAIDVHTESQLAVVQPWQPLRESALRQRFAYRGPGVKLLLLRVKQAEDGSGPVVDPDDPRTAGCVSWAPVDVEPPSAGRICNEDALQAALAALRGAGWVSTID